MGSRGFPWGYASEVKGTNMLEKLLKRLLKYSTAASLWYTLTHFTVFSTTVQVLPAASVTRSPVTCTLTLWKSSTLWRSESV